MKLENLSANTQLDKAAMDDTAGGLRFKLVWKTVRVVRYIFGIKFITFVRKLVKVYIY